MADMLDGLEALRRVMSLREIGSLIERTARWVPPETFSTPAALVSRAPVAEAFSRKAIGHSRR